MNRRVYRKIVKRVLDNQRAAIEAFKPMPPRTKLEKRVFASFLIQCDKICIPIAEEVIAEERCKVLPHNRQAEY
jgi:hypothetical protein